MLQTFSPEAFPQICQQTANPNRPPKITKQPISPQKLHRYIVFAIRHANGGTGGICRKDADKIAEIAVLHLQLLPQPLLQDEILKQQEAQISRRIAAGWRPA
ncbi:MAG: hypothetical protein RLZZ458_3650 [Planctomycetota bacterium]|jgi:hypothetical protein